MTLYEKLYKIGEVGLFILMMTGFLLMALRASDVLPNGPGNFSTVPEWHQEAIDKGHAEYHLDKNGIKSFRWKDCDHE